MGLFNPWKAGGGVENWRSVMGIAARWKQAGDLGLASAVAFVAAIAVSLGIMNLLPIPPLDGGRFVIEVFQKISRKVVTMRALNYLSAAGMILFIGFFLFMANQDIQRIISGAGFGGESALPAPACAALANRSALRSARKSLTCARFRHRNRSKSTMSTSYVHFETGLRDRSKSKKTSDLAFS